MTLTGNERKKLERNITIALVSGCLGWSRFFIPVMALFYIASQVPLEQFTIIMAIFSFVILVLEVPSGIFADLFGKRTSVILAKVCYLIEVSFLAFFNGFALLLLAKIVSGVGVSLSSGAKQALFYDSLKRLGREHEHKKLSGLQQSLSRASMAITFIIGGFLFAIDPKLPAFLSLPFLLVDFFLVLFYYEPTVAPTTTTFKHFKEGFVYVKNHASLRYLIIYSIPVAAAINMVYMVSSVHYTLILIPVFLIGVLEFFQSSLCAIASYFAHEFEEHFGERSSLFLIQIFLLVGLFFMMLLIPYFGVLPYYLLSFIFGLYIVITNHYVNEHAVTSHRATILSIRNMFNQLAIIILFPIMGLFAMTSFANALLFLFVTTLILVGLSFLFEKPRFFHH